MLVLGCGLGEPCSSRTPASTGLKRAARTPVSSPGSSTDNLLALHASCIIQRRWRSRAQRRERRAGEQPGSAGSCVYAEDAPKAAEVLAPPPQQLVPCDTPARDAGPEARTLLGAMLLAGLAGLSGEASAHEVVPISDCGHLGGCAAAEEGDTLAASLNTVAAAEAAAAAEAGLQSMNAGRATRALFGVATAGGQLERAVLAVLLRYALMKFMSAEHVDALLTADIGSFAASLTLGTGCGVAARALAAPLQAALAEAQRMQRAEGRASPTPEALPRLPPRRRARVPLPWRTLSGGLTRAFGLGAVQLISFNAIRAAETLCSAQMPQDGGLLLAGAAAGGLAAVARAPLDAGVAAARSAARAVLRGDAVAAARLLLLLDVAAFAALEMACARLGLDPVPL
jgi:hypothetical protein